VTQTGSRKFGNHALKAFDKITQGCSDNAPPNIQATTTSNDPGSNDRAP
jgi:hypothetical protein